MQQAQIHIVVDKLESFIRKYYLNNLFRGALLCVFFFALYFVSLATIETFAFLSISVRTILFFVSVSAFLFSLYLYVIVPLFKLYKIGKRLSYVEASKILNAYFPEIKDSIINTLELSQDNNYAHNELAIAAINQKIANISIIPFTTAIDFKKLLKYALYLVSVIFVFILVSLLFPGTLISGASRLFQYSQHFEKPAPFSFIVSEDSLFVQKGADYTIKLQLEGSYLPNNVEIVIGNNSFFMQKKSNSRFEYTCKSLHNTFSFYFIADNFMSKEYTLVVKPLPQLLQFTIKAKVPKYTGLEDFVVTNSGDISIPAGTVLEWVVTGSHIQNLAFKSKTYSSASSPTNSKLIPFVKNNDDFRLLQKIFQSTSYDILGTNSYFTNYPIISYSYTVIPDISPSIDLDIRKDSTQFYVYYYKASIQDDYGFSAAKFVYFDAKNPHKKTVIPIQFNPNNHKQDIFYMFNFSQFEKGAEIKYYFEVSDNDQVNGAKSVRSSVESFRVPTSLELQKMENSIQNSVEKSAISGMQTTQELLKDLENLKKKLLQTSVSEFEAKEIMKEMQQKQATLKEQLQKLSQSFDQRNDLKKQFSKQDEELLEKQKQIEDLLKSLMDEELQKMFSELQKLQDNFKKEDMLKNAQDMKLSVEDLAKQLDKDLALLKRLEVEDKVSQTTKKLDELSQKQESLSNDLKNKQDNVNKQDNINKEFDNIRKDFNNAIEKNNQLDNKINIPDFTEQYNDVDKSLDESMQQLQENKNSKSQKSMKDAAQKMQKLANAMQNALDKEMQEQETEDIQNLRKILDNLLVFSFNHEGLIGETSTLGFNDPRHVILANSQNRLRENFTLIRDSLFAISRRQPKISSAITSELYTIQQKLPVIINNLEQLQRSSALVDQRYVLASTNNLILLLGEVVNSMQLALNQEAKGGGQCKKPGGKNKKPGLGEVSKMQKSLKQQMQQMIDQMKKGQNQGKGMQQQMSKMLMQQQMMQQMMQDIIKNGTLSPDGVQQLKEIQRMMENTEHDIVNQRITQQTITRQEQILQRLLESEKSLRERDMDEKRESNEAKDMYKQSKDMFREDKKEQLLYEDELQNNQIKLKMYYKKIFDEYLINIDNK